MLLASLASSPDPSLFAASVKIKTQLARQHADNPSTVQLDLSTTKRSAVAQVQLRAPPRDSPEVFSTAVSRGRNPGLERHPRAMSCKNCPIHCPGHFPNAARAKSRDKSRDKSPSVYSSDVDCLYDDDLADEPLISALQARVAGIETEQRAQRLAIEGAFLRDPHVDSD